MRLGLAFLILFLDAVFSTLYITATTSVYRLETKTQGFVPYLAH
jgi:hypothetical protein